MIPSDLNYINRPLKFKLIDFFLPLSQLQSRWQVWYFGDFVYHLNILYIVSIFVLLFQGNRAPIFLRGQHRWLRLPDLQKQPARHRRHGLRRNGVRRWRHGPDEPLRVLERRLDFRTRQSNWFNPSYFYIFCSTCVYHFPTINLFGKTIDINGNVCHGCAIYLHLMRTNLIFT